MIVGIVNIGYGNIAAFEDIFEDLGYSVRNISKAEEIEGIDLLVLPGVGKYDIAMKELNRRGISNQIIERFAKGNLKILGVCLGMQLLFESSEEGSETGLGLLKGRFKRIQSEGIEHINMGWRSVFTSGGDFLGRFYFIHNFYLDQFGNNMTCLTSKINDENFIAGVMSKDLLLTQFHPEKSSLYGEKLISNWLDEK